MPAKLLRDEGKRPRRVRRVNRRRAILAALSAWAALLLAGGPLSGPAGAVTLPDHRAYELVTRFEEEGDEADLNAVQSGYGYTSRDGNALEWQALGGCCDAGSASLETYKSYRTADGWQTQAVSPASRLAEEGRLGLFSGEETQPEFWTPDMQRFVFAVPKAYEPDVNSQLDLYLREPDGEMSLLSLGPLSTGEELHGSVFGGATPDADHVVFSSPEALTADATGLGPEGQYLYLRDLVKGTTVLVDVDDSGALLGVEGASLGAAGYLRGSSQPANRYGTGTNAISNDGSKAFFQVPPSGSSSIRLDAGGSHLYMRDFTEATTTALDDPGAAGWARYEGADEAGSLVFFTSNEGLDGAPAVPELYVFNTTGAVIGSVPSMSSIPISLGSAGVAPVPAGPVDGISAIANDGSRAWFVAEDILAANRNPAGAEAAEGEPNLYMFDTQTGATTYVATLSPADVGTCQPSCAGGRPAGLLGEPDLSRRAFPTPDGKALVFESAADLTGKNDVVQTKLTAPAIAREHTIHVESTVGLGVNEWILVGSGAAAEREQIESIDSPTELTISGRRGIGSELAAGEPVVQLNGEVYRFLAGGSLLCLSCAGAGTVPTGSATLGIAAGGTYGPPGQNVPMNEDATQVFFQSPSPLVPEAQPARPGHESESLNVYEWEDGHVHLISDGTQSESTLDGTTPSGEDVFFSTRSQLTSGRSGNWINVYDARVDGGFPEPAPEPPPCVGRACRGPGEATPLFEVPATSLGETEEGPATGGGSFAVHRLRAAQRRRLARTGRLTLRVTTTAPGRLVATMRARLRRRSRRVARATAKLAEAGTARLHLVLSRAARRRLVARRSLGLRLGVAFSAGGRVARARLRLRVPRGTKGLRHRRSARHRRRARHG